MSFPGQLIQETGELRVQGSDLGVSGTRLALSQTGTAPDRQSAPKPSVPSQHFSSVASERLLALPGSLSWPCAASEQPKATLFRRPRAQGLEPRTSAPACPPVPPSAAARIALPMLGKQQPGVNADAGGTGEEDRAAQPAKRPRTCFVELQPTATDPGQLCEVGGRGGGQWWFALCKSSHTLRMAQQALPYRRLAAV